MDNENKKKKMIIISPRGKKTDQKAEELKWKRIARREQREMMSDRHPFAIQGVRNTNVQKKEKSASSIGQEAEKKNQAVADAQKVQSVKDFEVKQNINEA